MISSTDSQEKIADLSKANPERLNDLMSKDSRELTTEEMKEIVAHFRAGYKTWANEESSAKSTGRKAKRSKGQSTKTEGAVDLSKLDVDLGDI